MASRFIRRLSRMAVFTTSDKGLLFAGNKRQERSRGIYRFQENARWPEYADRSIHAKWLHGGEFGRCAPVHCGVPAGSSHAGLPQALGRAHKKGAFFFLHGLRETNWRVRG